MSLRWRHVLVLAGLALALVVVNLGIAGRERLLRDGQVVLLELAPVDPRSLMQGDYMALRFAIAEPLRVALGPEAGRHGDGYAVLLRAGDDTVSFVRAQAAPTPLQAGEVALRYRLRGGDLRLVTNAWFFAEGRAAHFEQARFGELRVGADGEALLVAMRDQQRQPL